MEQLAEVIKNGLNLSSTEISALTDMTFWYRLNGDTADYIVINGQTGIDSVSCARSGNTLTVTRNGANLDIENASGSSITVNEIAISGGAVGNGIDFRSLVPPSTITDIVIPDGQVARISSVSFNVIKQP